MIIREATINDIPQIQVVRNSVKENMLSDPNLVTGEDCRIYLTERGKDWVCEIENQIVGFAIADILENNIWALFVDPKFENQGVGKQLHNMMLNWYFEQSTKPVWLGTCPNTRAEKFYKLSGREEIGLHGKEVKFQMTFERWKNL